jgi:hypothetical protein
LIEYSWKDTYFSEKEVRETITKRIRFQNYKKLGNIMVPYKISLYEKGKKGYDIIPDTIIYKPKVKAGLFERPVTEQDLRYSEETYH